MIRNQILLTVFFSLLLVSTIQSAVLEDFKVMENEELQIGNLLVWSTSSDFDISHYRIQKASYGVDFENIGDAVDAKGKDFAKYHFLDPFANETTSYRLAMVTKKGKTIYSEAITINRQLKNDLIITDISGVEVVDFFKMNYYSKGALEISYEILNNKKEVILSDIILTQEGSNKFILSLSGYDKGYYTVLLKNGEEVEKADFLKL